MAILNNINEVLRRACAGDTFVAAGYAVSGGQAAYAPLSLRSKFSSLRRGVSILRYFIVKD